MDIKKYYLTKNKCYTNATLISPIGFMLHSTGANNSSLKRYVQPDDGLLGYNKNKNHWNTPDITVCVHGFIGRLENGTISAYQTLPYNYKAWHCGGSGNTTHVSWEMCEDGLDDEKYFNEVYNIAIDVAYKFCKEFGLKESCICDHSEGYELSIASNHGDVKHWFSIFGKTMDGFRKEVGDKLNMGKENTEAKDISASSWAKDAQIRMVKLGITDGTRPKDLATREEILVMLDKMYSKLKQK